MTPFEKRQLAQEAAAVVGVDAGKFWHTLVVRPRGGRDSKPLTVPITPDAFAAVAETILRLAGPGARPEQVLVGIEFAGSYGFTFAHYLRTRGFRIYSVLPAHTKASKRLVHGMALKTDAKDALTITDLVAQGKFVSFPFLEAPYAQMRSLVTARERLSVQRRATLSRLKSLLTVVWPEFEGIFSNFNKATPLVLLEAYPGPVAFRKARRKAVLALLRRVSRGKHNEATYERLLASATGTLALPGAEGAPALELRLQLRQLVFVEELMAELHEAMEAALAPLPEAPYLLSIPGVRPLTAAVFLGSIGDPRAYSSGQDILKVAGLALTKSASGLKAGRDRISKAGRPLLRAMAYMLAVRSIRRGGLFRTEYEGLLARGKSETKKKAVVAVSRSAVRLLFSIARDRRMFTVRPPGRAGESPRAAQAGT
jgi:transposase